MKESLLWKFSRPNEYTSHYIFGTMHVKSEDGYSSVALAKSFIEQCSIYAGEMDLNDPDLDNIGEMFLNDDGKSLMDLIGSKKYNKHKRILNKAFDINLDQIATFRPMVIANMISESILTKKYDLGLDHFLWNYAEALGMEMKGLESARNQFEIMKSIPSDLQLKSYLSCVKNVNSFRKKVLKLSELYRKGRLTQLFKTTKKSMGGLRKLMIYDRNAFMVKNLIQLTSEGSTFVAVGAAHLSGKKGMLALLKKEGYKVRSVV